MKKHDFKKLALMGITGALLVSTKTTLIASDDSRNHISLHNTFAHSCGNHGCSGIVADKDSATTTKLIDPASTNDSTEKDDKAKNNKDDNDGNLGYHLMTEQELLLELNDEGKANYNKLTPEGKELARKVASARCNGTNECRGLNACLTDKNECAGKGACKGQGKCAMADKNLAVELVSKKMAEKRNNATEQ
jgi:hypothetical protein